MKNLEFTNKNTFIAAVLGILAGGALVFVFGPAPKSDSNHASQDKEVLYWVAPMDSNFKRDEPGKSPMGMDLIPVYNESGSVGDAGPGTITIKPEVINNIGARTATVKKGRLVQEIRTVGYVKYDENKLIHIHPRVSGWIDELYVKAAGDAVKRDQPLYSLYSPELVNAQEELLLALNRNNPRLIKAAENRLKALQISDRSINEIKKEREVKQAILFYSPQDGVVDNLNIRQGYYVQPGKTLFSIGALDRVWVEAEIFERQASLINMGASVEMTTGYSPGKIWKGTIDYIYPAVDEKTRTVRVRLEFDNSDRKLMPNMFSEISIRTESEDEVVLAPKEAVIHTGSQSRVVLALGEGRFKSIEVKTGRENAKFIEILEGLHPDERVVSSAQFLIDSESSKTSDFRRMQSRDEIKDAPVWVSAEIKEQIQGERTVLVSHEAIEPWNMMAMTMNFRVLESVNFDDLTPGTKLHMQIQKNDGDMFEIVGTHIMSRGNQPTAYQWADVDGVVTAIDSDKGMVTIERGPIEKWNRPAAVVDFELDPDIDINRFVLGKKIYFRFEVRDGRFVLVKFHETEIGAAMQIMQTQSDGHEYHEHSMEGTE